MFERGCCMIRVLHVVNSMGCGGAENMIMNIYRNIDRKKVQFDFLVHTTKKGYFDEEIEKLGGRIFCISRFKLINAVKYRKTFDEFLKNHRGEFAVVHGHLGSSACIYLDVAKKHNISTIAHSHSANFSILSLKNIVYRASNIRTRSIAEHFFACSYVAGICRYGKKIVKQSNFKIIKNAIQLDKYVYNLENQKEVSKEFELNNKFVVGHVGRFDKKKNQTYVVKIFNEILKTKPDAVLMLVGDGEMRSEVEKLVKELDISDNVIMTGIRTDVNKLLQVMDCFVFPSISEGLGIVAIEAECFGIPCFINETLPRELYINDNVYGISLKRSPKEWAKIILEKSDTKIPETIAKDNVKNAGYDINVAAKMLEDFYIAHSK